MAGICGPPGGQQELAALYSRVAPIYAEQGPPFFEHAGRRLVELAQVRPGDVVLDVATGRGAVLIPAARRAGRTGQVVGIEIAPGMLAYTHRWIEDLGLTHASVELMDAAHLGLQSGAFTHALSSFAVFFFPNVGGVRRELGRVLRPGGHIDSLGLSR